MQTFQLHMLYYLNTYLGKEELFRKSRSISASWWREKWRASQNMYSVGGRLTVTVELLGVF